VSYVYHPISYVVATACKAIKYCHIHSFIPLHKIFLKTSNLYYVARKPLTTPMCYRKNQSNSYFHAIEMPSNFIRVIHSKFELNVLQGLLKYHCFLYTPSKSINALFDCHTI